VAVGVPIGRALPSNPGRKGNVMAVIMPDTCGVPALFGPPVDRPVHYEVVPPPLTAEHTGWMARRNIWCLVLGHRYHRLKLRGRTILTCKRCGDVDVVTKDMGGLQF
jgi:hypothetical protein